MGKIEFGDTHTTVEVGGHSFEFRALTVREMEGLVKHHEGDPEDVLTAAIIVAGNTDGKLAGFTADDFGEWPAGYHRKVQRAVAQLNGLGSTTGGN